MDRYVGMRRYFSAERRRKDRTTCLIGREGLVAAVIIYVDSLLREYDSGFLLFAKVCNVGMYVRKLSDGEAGGKGGI